MANNIDQLEHKLSALKADEGGSSSILAQMQEPPEVGSVFFARARHMIDPHNFYVLPLNNEKLLPLIEQPGIQCSQWDLQPGILIIYKTNQQYRRGLIREIIDGKCKIFAMDHGSEEDNVEIENIFKPLLDEARLAPPLALNCELYLCEPRGPVFDEVVIDAFKYFMGVPNEKLRITVKVMNAVKLKVIVHNSNADDVATVLAKCDYTQLFKVLPQPRRNPPNPPPHSFPWKHKILNVGETFRVRIQYGSSLSEIFVCTVEDFKDYCRNRADFASYCRSQNEISEQELVVGMPVGVMMEHHSVYERGVVDRILIPGYEAMIRLVDWGEVVTVTKKKVRPIRTEMFSMTPVRAFFCSALNGQEFINKLPMSLCKGYMYKMTIKKIGSEFDIPYLVTLVSAM